MVIVRKSAVRSDVFCHVAIICHARDDAGREIAGREIARLSGGLDRSREAIGATLAAQMASAQDRA